MLNTKQSNRETIPDVPPATGEVAWDSDTDESGSTPRKRAQNAYDALIQFTDFGCDEPETELETYMGDMVANMLHLCRLKGINFDEVVRRGQMHHDVERHGNF